MRVVMNCYIMIPNGKHFIYPAKPKQHVLSIFWWLPDQINQSEIGWGETLFISFMLFYDYMIWLSYGILYDSWIPLVCTGTRLMQVLSVCWIHGLVFGANRYHKSVCCTLMSNTHMDVILWSMSLLFWCILHFVLYCTVDLSRIRNRLKMYLVISRGIKYMKISLISWSISRLHFMLCWQV